MKVSTPDLCDDFGDAVQVAEPVFKHFGGISQFAGEVVTIKCFEDNSKVGQMLKTPGNGRVLVVDGGASPRRSLLGDMLVSHAVENGWGGIVIYGYIRDIEEIESMQMGVMALGTIPRKTEKRDMGDVNVTIEIAGMKIRPGDYIYVDRTGVVLSENKLLS